MKHFVFLYFILLGLSSCVKYEEPTLVSLPGEYIVDKITITPIDGEELIDSIYLPGTTFLNPNEDIPLDSVDVGFKKWHFDYSVVSFNKEINGWGQSEWTQQYFYNLIPSWTVYDLGYIDINLNGKRLIFKIIDDSAESLTLRTTGRWTFINSWEEKSITLHLTRTGP
jgi:hypothetical protein